MRIAFVLVDYLSAIGVGLLSNLARRHGHQSVTLFAGDRHFPQQLERFSPDLVAFSMTSGQVQPILNTAAWIKQHWPGMPVVVGGPHPTFVPEIAAEPAVDFAIRGEGEVALLELGKALEAGRREFHNIPNLIWQGDDGRLHMEPLAEPITDLDSLPHPDWDPYFAIPALAGFYRSAYTMIAGRGCPYSCSYCHNKQLSELYEGHSLIRRRSAEAILDEIRTVKRKYGVTRVRFEDDSFGLNKRHLLEFAEANAHDGLPFSVSTIAGAITEKNAELLAKAGCFLVSIGVESGDPELRRRVLNKHVTNEEIMQSVRALHQHGISVISLNMLASPGETLNGAMLTYRLNKQIKPDFAWSSIFQPYPGTALYDELAAAGRLPDQMLRYPENFFAKSIMKEADTRKIVALQALMAIVVRLRAPESLVRLLILPGENPLYRLLFYLSFFFGQVRTKRFPLIDAARFTWRNRPKRRRWQKPNGTQANAQQNMSWFQHLIAPLRKRKHHKTLLPTK